MCRFFRHTHTRHGIWQVLLVGKDEDSGVGQLFLAQHLLELVGRLADALAIVRVSHIDQTLRVLKVVAPQRSNLLRIECD